MPFMSPLSEHIFRCRLKKKIACLLVQVCQKANTFWEENHFLHLTAVISVPQSCWMRRSWPFLDTVWVWKKERKYHSNSIYIKRHI